MVKRKNASTSTPLVSIVILNWNGTDDTLACLDSVRNLDYANYEIIVVDNGSIEDISRLRRLDDITLVENQKNEGFTGGEITGLEHCNGQFILILNNDAIIDSHAITNALEVFQTDPKIAVVGGRSYLLNDNGNKQGIFHYTHQRVDPVSAEVHTYTKDAGVDEDVSTVSGACVLIRREAIEDCGYFDNMFFAYYEETDLFSRMRRMGWRIIFSPRVIIWHKMGSSTRNKKYMYNYLMFKNMYLFAYKNFDKKYLRMFKKISRRHFRRSFMIWAKRLGHVKKHDIIYKARVHAYFYAFINWPRMILHRKKVFQTNPSYSLNNTLFHDNPLPVSICIDATTITAKQVVTLQKNLTSLLKSAVKPAEVLIVSKKKIELPPTPATIRFANIVDKQIAAVSVYDYFFMTSNNDQLLFGKSAFYEKVFTNQELATLNNELRGGYEKIVTNETVALLTGPGSGRVSANYLKNTSYQVVEISKQTIVNHLSEHGLVDTIDENVLIDVIGRSVAQCIDVRKTEASVFFGVDRGKLDTSFEPILDRPFAWTMKSLLTHMHIWGILVKILRKLKSKASERSSENKLAIPPQIDAGDKNIPIFFNTRDRFDPLLKMLKWLEKSGYKNVIFVDNDSTYPPLIEYFERSPYQYINLGRNGMHKAPWESMAVRFFAKDKPYILSDPDIIPENTPTNTISYFGKLLNKYPDINKVGAALRIDNIPDENRQKDDIMSWESRFWLPEIGIESDVYNADVDTTFALYRPRTWWFLTNSLRVAGPYAMVHEPWLQSSKNPTEEFIYYKMRASREVSTWGMDELPKHHRRALKKEGFIDDIIDEED